MITLTKVNCGDAGERVLLATRLGQKQVLNLSITGRMNGMIKEASVLTSLKIEFG